MNLPSQQPDTNPNPDDVLPVANSKRALTFILVNVTIDIIGLGIIIPVLPELIREIEGSASSLASMSDAAIIGGWLMFAYAFMQFIFAPILGNLSDRFGRRPILLWGLFGLGIDYIIMALAPTIFWLFVGRILAGMAGASYVTAFSYIADVSSKDKRAANFGLIGMAFGIGFIIGPAIGGLLGAYDPRLPFWFAAGLCFVNLALGYFVLPESLAQTKRRKFELSRANPLGALKQFLYIKPVLMIIIAATIFEFASQVYPSLWAYFTPVQYGWSTAEVGLSLAIFGLIIAISEGFVLRIVLNRYGEHKAIVSSIGISIACFLAFSVVTSSSLAYVVMVVSAFSGFAGSSLHGLASNHAAEDVQGELNGAIMSAASIVQIIAPPLMTGIFALMTLETAFVYFPGAPFVLSAVLVALVAIPYLKARKLGIRDSAGIK